MSTAENKFRFDSANLVLVVALLVSIGLLFAYVRANGRLHTQLQMAASQLKSTQIQAGDLWPPLAFKDGQGTVIPSLGQRQLVLVGSKNCKACVEMEPQWRTIAANAIEKHCQVRFVSLDQDLPLPVTNDGVQYLKPLPQFVRTARIDAVPVLALVAPRGRVEWVHIGTPTPNHVKELMDIIGRDCQGP
jgi:hypothetical protein